MLLYATYRICKVCCFPELAGWVDNSSLRRWRVCCYVSKCWASVTQSTCKTTGSIAQHLKLKTFVSWNFGWGRSLLKSTGVSGFQCERGCEKRHYFFIFFLWILSCWQKFYGPPCFCSGGNTESPRHFVQAITSILRISNKNVKDSVLILTHQKTVEVSLLGQKADISKQNDRNDEQSISRSRWLFDVFPCL